MPKLTKQTLCFVYEFRCNVLPKPQAPSGAGAGAGAGAGDGDAAVPTEVTADAIGRLIKDKICKKVVFQKEKADSGYLHWQGRLSLIKKRRKHELLALLKENGFHPFEYLEPTSNTGLAGPAFYAMKEDTRVGDKTYTEKDFVSRYVPKQFRGMEKTLRPWQKQVLASAHTPGGAWDPRTINVVVDATGNKGKTVLVHVAALHHGAIIIPAVRDFDRLLGTATNILSAKESQQPPLVFCDIPRGLKTSEFSGLMAGMEKLKDGYVWDTRYHLKDWWFDSPSLWLFSNSMIDYGLLSPDRWAIWTINDDFTLKRVNAKPSEAPAVAPGFTLPSLS